MAKEFKISALRLKELEQELFYLKTTREKEVAEQIKEARSFGDLSENSEYDEAKNEQAKLYGRIAEVEDILIVHVVPSVSVLSSIYTGYIEGRHIHFHKNILNFFIFPWVVPPERS